MFKANFLKLSETIFRKSRFLRHTSDIILIQLLKTPLNNAHGGYYMAVRGYEFYLQVLKVFLILMKFLDKTQLFFIHFRNSKIVQLKWSPITKYLSQKCYETQI